ncbi:MAG: bifunctional phosphoglucose/phosphomannose isomerase [Candidatus Saganbacteria bacterium]|nr:bifunctional phosphoglucose/phosphomannose isomerase [Candidatus Saganbacteria bacterium]
MSNKFPHQKGHIWWGNKSEQGFLKEVKLFPQMLSEALSFGSGLTRIRQPKSVFVAGMGGSSSPADISAAYLRDSIAVPITVIRDYSLPACVKKDDLLVCISYSGNTEETLSLFASALKKNIPIVCITSGGKLEKLAKKNNLPLVLVKGGVQPRSALPYLLVSLLLVLEKAGLIPSQRGLITKAAFQLTRRQNQLEAEAKRISRRLRGKIPIIFASEGITSAAGYRFKTQFNENSKVTAHLSIFPELNHNEIVNISYLKRNLHDFFLIILRDKEEHPRVKKRIILTKKLIYKNIGAMEEIFSIGGSRLARLLSLIYTVDFLTANLAILYNRSPADVLVIEKLKALLKGGKHK